MNPNRRFKDEIYDQFSRIGKAVSSPKRLELLDILCQGERTVEILAREPSLTVANTSQHLQVLKNSRLVEQQKKGLYVVYSPAPMVCEFFFSMRQVAENRIAEIEQIKNQFLAGKKGMEPLLNAYKIMMLPYWMFALLKNSRQGTLMVHSLFH